jgi:hypothetical protein
MPLTWDINNCRDADSLLADTYIDPSQNGEVFTEDSTNEQRNQHRVTTHMATMMYYVGINKITSDNIYEVAERYNILCTGDDMRVGIWEDFTGNGELKYHRIKLNTLHFGDYIGMQTNVTNQTREEWVAALRDGYAVDNWLEAGVCWAD